MPARKRNKKKKSARKKQVPFVSVCTPTFNRRPFYELCCKCLEAQTYPHERMEWLILDDGTDPIKDIVDAFASTTKINVRYFRREEYMPLATKRNFLNDKADGSFICFWDDDDYYPPTRIAESVKALKANPDKLIAGGSAMYCYFPDRDEVWQLGPYGTNHSTAAVFFFRKELLEQTTFDEHLFLSEEKSFLKNYTIPMHQLPPSQTIVVVAHSQNSFDKRTLIENGNTHFVKKTKFRLEDLVPDHDIRHFIQSRMERELAAYTDGDIRKKPDILLSMLNTSRTRYSELQKEYQKIAVAYNRLLMNTQSQAQKQAATQGNTPTILADAPKHVQKIYNDTSNTSQSVAGGKRSMRGPH